MSDSLITIVTPVYNREKLLPYTIESILAQDSKDWKLILVDDGSTDGSVEVAKKYAKQDNRIKFLERGDQGKGGGNTSRNIGWRAATTPYVMFLDSDDALSPFAISQRTKAVKENPKQDFLVFPTGLFDQKIEDSKLLFNIDKPDADDLDRLLDIDMPWSTSGALWQKSTLQSLGGWDEELPSWQDWDLDLRAVVSGLSYTRVGKVDSFWRNAADDTVGVKSVNPDHLYAHRKLMQKMIDLLEDADILTPQRKLSIGGLYLFFIKRWLTLREFAEATGLAEDAKRKGLFSTKMLWDTKILIFLYRFKLLGVLWRKYISFSWPRVATNKYSKTFKQVTYESTL